MDNVPPRVRRQLPVEICSMIGAAATGPEDVSTMRLVPGASWGAAKTLFKSIEKRASEAGLEELFELANSKYRLLVESLTLRCPLPVNEGPDPDRLPHPSTLAANIARFGRLEKICLVYDNNVHFGLRAWTLLNDLYPALVADKLRIPPKLLLIEAQHFPSFEIDTLNFEGVWSSLIELELKHDPCDCQVSPISLLAPFVSSNIESSSLRKLVITQSRNGWHNFQNSITQSPTVPKLPNLETLELCNVELTAVDLLALFKTSPRIIDLTLRTMLLFYHPGGPRIDVNSADVIQSRWKQVFDHLKDSFKLTNFVYDCLVAVHSDQLAVGSTITDTFTVLKPWQVMSRMPPAGKILGILDEKLDEDHRALGRLLISVEKNARDVGKPLKLDRYDRAFMRQAAAANAPRRRSTRVALAAASERITRQLSDE